MRLDARAKFKQMLKIAWLLRKMVKIFGANLEVALKVLADRGGW